MLQVCEVYRLHRETYHLAVDFIDRYLSATRGYLKSQLQLLGITSLFVAAKLEVCRLQLLLWGCCHVPLLRNDGEKIRTAICQLQVCAMVRSGEYNVLMCHRRSIRPSCTSLPMSQTARVTSSRS